jgi:hypothetical protein
MSKRDKIIMITGLAVFVASVVFLVIVLILNLGDKPSASNSGGSNSSGGSSNSDNSSATEALQRNQRNDARKRNVSNIVAATNAYIANNQSVPDDQTAYDNGKPDLDTKFGHYLDDFGTHTKTVHVYRPKSPVDDFSNPASQGIRGGLYMPNLETITVFTGQTCNGSTGTRAGTESNAAVVTQIETDDDSEKFYCQSAQ